MKKFKHILSLALAFVCAIGCVMNLTTTAIAADVANATIDTDANCSITLYKYDWTNAVKDGAWDNSYVSTGVPDASIGEKLGERIRKGDTNESKDNTLGNGQNSNSYAIKGVEFSYLNVAEIVTFSETVTEKDEGGAEKIYNTTQVLYGFDKTKGAELLTAIGLAEGTNSFAAAANSEKLDQTKWYYTSDTLNAALAASLNSNATTVKNALETYIKTNLGTNAAVGGTMPLTSEDGYTKVTGLKVGLYLMVETKVPEMVTATVNPFFLSLPMTSVDGTNATDGGHRWMYDVTLYPKNETGIVTLEKTVREAKADTGTHGGSTTDITDGYAHNATASANDVLEYQIISTLPTITSEATSISEYTFKDVLSKGLYYTSDSVKIEWFKDTACTPEKKVAEWIQGDGHFTVSQVRNDDKSHTMTIAMTEAGLAVINGANTSANNSNGSLYAGYSNYTMRITYSAVLHPNEAAVFGDSGNCNEVALTWSRTSYGYYDMLVDDSHVYTYGIDLTKAWSDKTPAEAKEAGMYDHVLFTMQNKTDGYYVIAKLSETEGIWYVIGHTTSESEATDMHPVSWNGNDGQLVIKGLEADEYILTEVETANGYTLLKDSISVVITATDDANRPCSIYSKDKAGLIQNDSRFNFDGGLDLHLANIPQSALAHNFLTASAVVDGNKVTMLYDEVDDGSSNALVPLTVTNTKGFDLPQSGQTGIKWLPIIGGTMTGLAALSLFVVLVLKRRKEEDRYDA